MTPTTRNHTEDSPESLYRTIFNAANIGIWVIDQNWRTTSVNPCMCRMLGYELTELLGRSPRDFIDPREAVHWDALVLRREAGIEEEHDFLFRRKDGTELWVIVAATPLRGDQGQFLGGLAIMTEVTQRRLWEARALKAKQMEVARSMTNSVAHQFNNKLQPLLSYVDLALRDSGITESTRGYLGRIHRIVESCQETIGQIVAALESPGRSRVRADLNAIIQTYFPDLQEQCPDYVQLSLALEHEPCHVEVDPRQINLTLFHLCRNAFQAVSPTAGGIVRIAVRRENDSLVSVSVEDNGVGMDPELLRKACEPFYSTKPPDHSWGQGLYYASEVIRAHGGTLQITSEPGKGSVVTFRLPAFQLTPQKIEPGETLKVTRRLLLVDDSRETLTIWKEFLEMEGFLVHAFTNGQQAMTFVANHKEPLDLIVTDLRMPGVNGVELINFIRASEPDLPGIILTGDYRTEAEKLAEGTDHLEVLLKPVRLEALLKSIARMTG